MKRPLELLLLVVTVVPSLERCKRYCDDLGLVDDLNCGACEKVCSTARAHMESHCHHVPEITPRDRVATSQCVDQCSADFLDCDGDPANGCETPMSSTANCGRCGRQCEPVQVCQRDDRPYAELQPDVPYWNCTLTTCTGPRRDCDGYLANDCEIDTRSDAAHCGTCRARCEEGLVCSSGRCACPSDLYECVNRCGFPFFGPDRSIICAETLEECRRRSCS